MENEDQVKDIDLKLKRQQRYPMIFKLIDLHYAPMWVIILHVCGG